MYKSIIILIITVHNVFGGAYNEEVVTKHQLIKSKASSVEKGHQNLNIGEAIPPDFDPKKYCQLYYKQDYHQVSELPFQLPYYPIKHKYNYGQNYHYPVKKFIAHPIYINKPPIHKIIKQPVYIQQKYHISKVPVIHEKHKFEVNKEAPIIGSVEKILHKKEKDITGLYKKKEEEDLKEKEKDLKEKGEYLKEKENQNIDLKNKEKYNENTNENFEIDARKLDKHK